MDLVLTLHSHLPWVLHHGRWPHGSDWLCEAAVDTYLPLLAALDALERQAVPVPLTIGVTPVLANQLAHPDFGREVEAFLAQRIEACDEALADFRASGEDALVPLTGFWRVHLTRLRRRLRAMGWDPIARLRHHAQAGRVELTSSAATHGFLPLLARDESIRLQLRLGQAEHRRLFGSDAAGCWVPECAYRPAGPWAPHPSAPEAGHRRGLEDHLAGAGFAYFFADAHQAEAGRTLGLYGEPDVVDGIREPAEAPLDAMYPRSPYRAYDLAMAGPPVSVLVRDPVSSLRVWSRYHGFPGDDGYLEFHKIRWPGGLKLWRVTGTQVELGAKQPYDPNVARARAHRHAGEFVALLVSLASAAQPAGGEVIAVPFDTELFGHWWFEGVDFLGDLYRGLARQGAVRPAAAGTHLARAGRRPRLALAEGSWGANGDFSKWLNPETAWTWQRLWPLEARYWDLARAQLPGLAPGRRAAWAQATRELLLAQSSDWQFIISTGAAADYAERRFSAHCEALAALLDGLEAGGSADGAALDALTARLHALDDLFPDPLPAALAALQG